MSTPSSVGLEPFKRQHHNAMDRLIALIIPIPEPHVVVGGKPNLKARN